MLSLWSFSVKPKRKRFAIKPKKLDDEELDLVQRTTLKVDISFMAQRIREFYARKEMCEHCIEAGKECPYNYDIIACIYGEDSISWSSYEPVTP